MDHSHVGLQSVIKSLSDVVAPAVDSQDSLAKEQLRLCIDYISFIQERLEFLGERALFELSHSLEMAKSINALLKPATPQNHSSLTDAISSAESHLPKSTYSIKEMNNETARLGTEISKVLGLSQDFEPSLRTEIEKTVLHLSKDRAQFERSWYVPLGLDPDAKNVTPLHDLIRNRN